MLCSKGNHTANIYLEKTIKVTNTMSEVLIVLLSLLCTGIYCSTLINNRTSIAKITEQA